MNKIKASYAMRFLTLGIGAFSNFLVATIILNSFSYEGYAIWVILTSLPSLMPFADFGLGTNVFNYFADKSRGREAKNNVTELFMLSSFLSFLLVLISAFCVLLLSKITVITSNVAKSHLYFGLGIVVITLAAVPFSLAAKKLFAEEKISTVFFLQGLIPPLTATTTFLLLKTEYVSLSFLVFVPSIIYLVTTLAVFKVSGIAKSFASTSYQKFRRNIKMSLSLGIWSLCVTSIMALVWQAPKYLIQAFGTAQELTSYSLMSLFLIPGLSLIAVASTWHTTKVRRRDLSEDVVNLTRHSIRISHIASVLFSCTAFLGFYLLGKMEIVVPEFESQFIAFVALIFSSYWLIPISSFTSTTDLRWIAIRIIPCFIISMAIFSALLNFFFYPALLIYVVVFNSLASYFSTKRLSNLQDA